MLSTKNKHANWIFFSDFHLKKIACIQSNKNSHSAGSTYSKTAVSGIKLYLENTPRYVSNCFEPTAMLGLSSMAIEWPLDNGIPSRRRTYTLGCRPTPHIFLHFLFLSSSFTSSFLHFFLSFLSSFSTHRTYLPLPLSFV